MDHVLPSSIDPAPAIPDAVRDALGLRRPAGSIDRLVNVQVLERTIAALRAENLALRIHVQELERLLLDGETERQPAPLSSALHAANGEHA
jgi:hypothetical protein